MFCSEHLTGKHDFFTSHFHYNLYLKWILSIISHILSLWNLFETKIVANGALDPFKILLYSSPENEFSIKGELTAPWVKSLFILYSKIFVPPIYVRTLRKVHREDKWKILKSCRKLVVSKNLVFPKNQ